VVSGRGFVYSLTAVVVLAGGVFAAVIATRDPTTRSNLWFELGKGMIQLLVVVVVGALLKFIADGYQARSARAAAQEEFRRDKHRRLVAATATMRKVPVLIEANRSVKTWSEQMLAAIDVGGELRTLRHEIEASNASRDPPFAPTGEDLATVVRGMVRYMDDWLAADFREHKDPLGELQREAERQGITPEERRNLREQIWTRLQQLRSIADMQKGGSDRQEGWGKYLADYEMALDLMTRASFPREDRSRRERRERREGGALRRTRP
jgi:hypothetical protein